ncbi:MAG TPA: DUF1330 domain-containing protein [Melioribacteraceae bacterium]|nr:DUF1330 domain-containing protein [Melioribacteraceae bacterium]
MVYFVANIKIEDDFEYNKYLDKVDEIFSKFNGKYLVVEDNPKLMEGNRKYNRVVIIQFENEDDFNKWYFSNEYQNILIHRLKGAECSSILVNGK